MILAEPGFYAGVPATAYHGDPAPEPSLSSSVARLLVEHSPMHARHAHPRLNPGGVARAGGDAPDTGELAHALLLEGEAAVAVFDGDDWRGKAAREFRAEAREAGRIPVKAGQWERVRGMVRAFEAQGGRDLLGEGEPEATLLWREPAGCWCRARLDWWDARRGRVADLKTTAGSVHPDKAAKRLFEGGYDVQAAFYARGVERLTGRAPRSFTFLFLEAEPPHALCAVEVCPASLAMAGRMVDHAVGLWARCLREGSWPGYGGQVWRAETPPWRERAWLAREMSEGQPSQAVALSRPLGGES